MNTRIVKIIFPAIMIICFLFSSGMTQESTAKPYEWALQFVNSDNFKLTSFQGSTIFISKQVSPGRHFRAGMSFSGSTDDSDFTDEYPVTDALNEADKTLNTAGFELTTQYIADFKKRNRVTAYIGVGPKLEYLFTDEKHEENYDYRSDIWKEEDNYKKWSVGLSGVLGVAWFVSNDISILGEYGSELMVTKTSQKRTYGGDTVEVWRKTNSTSYHFFSGGVKLGISIHF